MSRKTRTASAGQTLSPAKQKLLEARLSRAVNKAASTEKILASQETQRFPATSPQTRFWFIDELHPGSAAYNMHVAVELSGQLDRDALQSAVQSVVDRHDVLRSTFALQDGLVWQEIGDRYPLELTFHERRSYSEPESLLMRLSRIPFSLRYGPLFRADLIELERERHILLIVMHHIICDEASIDVLLRQIGRSYESSESGSGDEQSVSFADYAKWQSEQLPGQLEKQLPYWIENLAGLDERASVPVNRPRNDTESPRGKIVRKKLGLDLLQAAKALAGEEQMTILPVVLSAWCTLLHRYTGLQDIAVGSPASQRTRSELDETIGLFLNTLVFRAGLQPTESFRTLLRRVRDITLNAFSRQDVPFETIVEQLNPHRSRGDNPFFDTMIVQESEAGSLEGFGSLAAKRRMVDAEVCKFDLTLFFREQHDGLLLSIEYDTHLYDRRRIESTLDHLAELLSGSLLNPDQSIADVSFLKAEELNWLQHRSAGPWQDIGDSPTVAAQIETNLGSLADQVAIVDKKGAVTYHELNRLVSGMTDAILETLDSPGCIMVLLDRDRWAIAAMLAAWRTGTSYVPLDPDYPITRISDTVQAVGDYGDCLVVTSRQHEHLVPGGCARILVDAPRGVSATRHQPAGHQHEGTAYTIFTSGSSGRPKGVRITHENLRVSNEARQFVYGKAPERFLLLSPLAFDSSVAGLFWTLAGGGTLVIADSDEVRDSRKIARLIDEQKITHTLLLPSLYELVLRSAGNRSLRSLDTVVVAGEPCPDFLYPLHVENVDNCSLYNEYGPSEATVWATVQRVENEHAPVPIGAAIPSMRTYVLDQCMQLQAPGIAGELCLEGPALSPGYVDDSMTGKAFVDVELFGERRRVYRTGDQVRLDDEGRLLFLGRVDNQVKVRGHRVELEEINAAVRRIASVSDVATVFDASRQSLVSFVAKAEAEVDADVVISALIGELPDYMVPRQLLVLDELPRLPNGKLDLSAIPELRADEDYEEPDEEDYRTLKAIWCEVLKIEDSRPDASFFDLGGHSLLALTLLLQIENRYGRRLSLASLYVAPTLLALYARLSGKPDDNDRDVIYPARPEGSKPPLFIALAPLEHLIDKIDPDVPVLGLYHGVNPPPGPDVTVEDMATRYIAAVRRQQPEGPYRLAGFSFGSMLVMEMTQQLQRMGEKVEQLILLDPPPPIPEGDMKFRTNRVLGRIRSAGSGVNRITFAISELYRIGRRVIVGIRHRVNRRLSRALGRVPQRAALVRAGNEWAKQASMAYRYQPTSVPVLLIIPTRPEVSVNAQLARWEGVLNGRLQVQSVDGPTHHLELLEEPWVAGIGAAINETLSRKSRVKSGAA